MRSKSCSFCKLEKKIDSFYKKERGYLGVDSKCKQCVLVSKHKYYKKAKRSKVGTIEFIEDDAMIPNEAIYLMEKYLRGL